MSQHSNNQPVRLTLANQPSREGRYADIGEPHRDGDDVCGFEILDNFERFNQANDIYTRGQWDSRIRSDKVINWFKGMFTPGIGVKQSEGYSARDFALKNAGWMATNLIIQRNRHADRTDGFLGYIQEFCPPSPVKMEIESVAQMTAELKHACRTFGASDVGITAYDPRWHYTKNFSAKNLAEKDYGIPEDLPNVIVVLTEMDHDVIRTYPSATAGMATGSGYSHDCAMTLSIATFIQNMGYRAVATVNDTSQFIPYAIQAGMGEYGRHGLLIHPKFGPRLRIGRIHTDLPLDHDQPIRFGVKEFCEICRRCSDACPPQAIPGGAPQDEIINQSNIVGVRKWSVDAEKCFQYWVNQGTECGICIRVCPYNKDPARLVIRLYHRLWLSLAASPFRKLALWLDIKLGFGGRLRPNEYWKTKLRK